MLRRSDFIAATYALSLVFANFGIAIAARMPMITTTIRSSIRVKPFLAFMVQSPESVGDGVSVPSSLKRRTGRSTAPDTIAGSIPETRRYATNETTTIYAAELKLNVRLFACILRGQMHSAIHQLVDALAGEVPLCPEVQPQT